MPPFYHDVPLLTTLVAFLLTIEAAFEAPLRYAANANTAVAASAAVIMSVSTILMPFSSRRV
jgi:hypothetical protein